MEKRRISFNIAIELHEMAKKKAASQFKDFTAYLNDLIYQDNADEIEKRKEGLE